MSAAVPDYHQGVEIIDIPDLAPPAQAPGVAAPVAPAQTPAPIVRPTHVATSRAPSQPPQLHDDDALRMASILTGANETPNGTGTMHARQPGADLDKQFENASHHTVVIGNGDHTSRTGRERIGTDPYAPLVDDPTLMRAEHRAEVPIRISLDRPRPDQPTTLTPDAVVDKIRDAYMAGLERCYRKGLAADATLSGNISISFTVTAHGQVADPEASGVNEQVDGCVAGQMSSWHFAIPRDKDGDPTDVTFHVVLALRPS
jgi:hypothetical protein